MKDFTLAALVPYVGRVVTDRRCRTIRAKCNVEILAETSG